MRRVLVVDDNRQILDLLSMFLGKNGFEVSEATDGNSALGLLQAKSYDLVLLDMVLPGMDGMDLLREALVRKIDVPFIVITGFGTIETAVKAMKLGAVDYVTKPFILEDLLITINRSLDYLKLQRENTTLKEQLREQYNFRNIVGNSQTIQRLFRLMDKIAGTDSTILISGESGTGKELVAKTIHVNSPRSNHPFVPLNCGAVPAELIESELFGHEKGAFTGAINTRIGRFELADGGTLFLDEIGEIPPSLQVKLLRVIQEREFERVGGTKTISVDVRIIAATNRDLEKAMLDGEFREDLYYRLNVIPVHVPALRDRVEDIPVLFKHFMEDFSQKRKKSPVKITPEVAGILSKYEWPGNVRELQNVVERMIILDEDGLITEEDLPDRILLAVQKSGSTSGNGEIFEKIPLPWNTAGVDMNGLIDSLERYLIVQALDRAGGVKNRAAELLQINRTTLIDKIKKKQITVSGTG